MPQNRNSINTSRYIIVKSARSGREPCCCGRRKRKERRHSMRELHVICLDFLHCTPMPCFPLRIVTFVSHFVTYVAFSALLLSDVLLSAFSVLHIG
ncbi:hypothetical protein DFJ73DRAFT_453910 [Zopfochytrium polystomum]|nr:hypothetical protein DFJ73DRAFT_453910 [Zopfochytrium polystomum]